MARTYDRLAARAAGGRVVEVAKVVEVRGGDAIGAKDRPGHLTGASDQDVVAWAKRGLDTLSLDGSPHATPPEAMRATTLQLGDKGETPLQELEARELGGAIERAIARLRPEYRSCILLRHVEGHSYEEI